MAPCTAMFVKVERHTLILSGENHSAAAGVVSSAMASGTMVLLEGSAAAVAAGCSNGTAAADRGAVDDDDDDEPPWCHASCKSAPWKLVRFRADAAVEAVLNVKRKPSSVFVASFT